MRRSSSVAKGFTLIELVLVLALAGLVLGLAAQPLQRAIDAAFSSQRLADAQSDLGAALDRMARDVRSNNASCLDEETLELTSPGDGTTLTYRLEERRLVLDAGDGPSVLAGSSDDPIDRLVCINDFGDTNADLAQLDLGTLEDFDMGLWGIYIYLATEDGYETEMLVASRPGL